MTDSARPPRQKQRDKARETARLAREADRKRQRRRRLLIQSVIGVVVLAIVAVIIVVVTTANHSPAPVSAGQSPKNMATGGIAFTGSAGAVTPVAAPAAAATKAASAGGTLKTSGVPHVVTYIDWSCPVCQQFEAAYSTKLQSLVASGKATLEIHPIAILDRNYQNSRYSSRATNAAACVANFEPSKFLAVQSKFYASQPKEGSTGLTNSQILGLIRDGGGDNSSVTACVNKESFKNWVTSTTQTTTSETSLVDPTTGQFGTPTVFVNGKRWAGTTDLLAEITAAG